MDLIRFERAVYMEGSDWIVKSSYVDDIGVVHSLQMRYRSEPSKDKLQDDHLFLEQKLIVAAHLKLLRDAGMLKPGVLG